MFQPLTPEFSAGVGGIVELDVALGEAAQKRTKSAQPKTGLAMSCTQAMGD